MLHTVHSKGPGIHLSVEIEAQPATVYRFISTSEGFSAWMGCKADFEAVVGRAYRLEFGDCVSVIEGEVLEVEADRRVVMTWGTTEGAEKDLVPVGSTTLALTLEPSDAGTRVTLQHDRFPSEEGEKNYANGWRFHLSRLGMMSNRTNLTEVLPAVLDDYFAAWSEDDAERRLALFEQTCTDDVVYGDDYSAFTGRDLLALHAANTRGYMPNLIYRRVGEPAVCRGNALVRWEVRNDSEVVMAGTNQIVANADGRLQRVVVHVGAF